ncbi:MAG: NADH-quinone oxidoreductase subunit M, partial [Silvibacterium sp.]
MILPGLVLILIVGGIVSWIVARRSEAAARWIAVVSVLTDLSVCFGIWIAHLGQAGSTPERWFVVCDLPWIPQFGIRIHMAIDGLSLAMLLLTYFLGIMAVLSSWTEIRERVGFF